MAESSLRVCRIDLARLLLKNMLEQLPSTLSGKGLYIALNRKDPFVYNMASVFTFYFYPLHCVEDGNTRTSRLDFQESVAKILRYHVDSLRRIGVGDARIDKGAIDAFLSTVLEDVDSVGFFGNFPKKEKIMLLANIIMPKEK